MKKFLVFIIILLIAGLSSCTSTDDTAKEGQYSVKVTLTGGSGKTTVESPAEVILSDGEATATIKWSSPHYDYMIVNGEKYIPINTEGNSVFEIPVVMDEDMEVIADTVAMSEPHEIEYVLNFESASLKLIDQEASDTAVITDDNAESNAYPIKLNKSLGNDWKPERTMELTHAKNFSVNYYNGNYTLISISDGSRYLLVPDEGEIPEGIDEDITILYPPVKNIYLVATSAMCLFDDLDSLDSIRLSGTKAEDWYIPNAKTKMQEGDILYGGKYRSPDYELIMTNKCSLAIESTMINHNPEVKEKLEDVGIAVLVDCSGYETHPLGRTEWIKLYGVLTGKEELAERLFDEQVSYMEEVSSQENTGKTVAYFYINSSGYAVARKSGDYVAKMIELAGGNYIFENLGDSTSATSTINLEMEKFYATAKDADYIIYNSTIGGEVSSIDELLSKNSLLKEFKAVKNNNVWCTDKNLYQETTELGTMISDIHRMLTESDDNLTKLNFMYKLQ